MMFWRIPASDHLVDSFFKDKKLKEIGFVLKSKITNEEIETKLSNDPNFREACTTF